MDHSSRHRYHYVANCPPVVDPASNREGASGCPRLSPWWRNGRSEPVIARRCYLARGIRTAQAAHPGWTGVLGHTTSTARMPCISFAEQQHPLCDTKWLKECATRFSYFSPAPSSIIMKPGRVILHPLILPQATGAASCDKIRETTWNAFTVRL